MTEQHIDKSNNHHLDQSRPYEEYPLGQNVRAHNLPEGLRFIEVGSETTGDGEEIVTLVAMLEGGNPVTLRRTRAYLQELAATKEASRPPSETDTLGSGAVARTVVPVDEYHSDGDVVGKAISRRRLWAEVGYTPPEKTE